MLYTVKFTTQKLITRISADGKTQTKERFDTPIVITALPHATAMSYSGCDNFTIEPYVMEPRRASRSGVGNGTKQIDYDNLPARTVEKRSEKIGTAARVKTTGMTKTQRAAISGNMTEAISG